MSIIIPMQPELFQTVSKNFEYLIPRDKESLLVLFHLFTRIEKREIEETFTQHEFEEAIDDVTAYMRREKEIRKEVLSKRLSQRFLTTLKSGNQYLFQLTVFTKELLKLLRDELQPQYEHVELIHTFRRTIPIHDEDLEALEKFEYWSKNHYEPSKKVILAHCDSLQRFADNKISELRQLLSPEAKKPRDLITRFIIIFEQLGRQTEGIIHTLNFKDGVIDKVKKAEEKFSETKEVWEKYIRIREEVTTFFDNIDRRVLSINDKIQLTCSRLKSLYDTLRYKQEFKLKIEKFMNLLLTYTKWEEGELKIPDCIGKKMIPCLRERFYYVPPYYFGNIPSGTLPDLTEDEAYRLRKEEEKMVMLKRQEAVSHWISRMDTMIHSGNKIIFEEWFEKMFAEEKNLEVPMDACFGMIQQFHKQENLMLEVKPELYQSQNDPIALWKMRIHPATQ